MKVKELRAHVAAAQEDIRTRLLNHKKNISYLKLASRTDTSIATLLGFFKGNDVNLSILQRIEEFLDSNNI
jgi:transcriptional regulator with XRE-family HTH domain